MVLDGGQLGGENRGFVVYIEQRLYVGPKEMAIQS
jgi:hypothetical protein